MRDTFSNRNANCWNVKITSCLRINRITSISRVKNCGRYFQREMFQCEIHFLNSLICYGGRQRLLLVLSLFRTVQIPPESLHRQNLNEQTRLVHTDRVSCASMGSNYVMKRLTSAICGWKCWIKNVFSPIYEIQQRETRISFRIYPHCCSIIPYLIYVSYPIHAMLCYAFTKRNFTAENRMAERQSWR